VEQNPKGKVSDADVIATLADGLKKEVAELTKKVEEEKKGRLDFTRGMTVRDSSANPPATHLFYQETSPSRGRKSCRASSPALDPNPRPWRGPRASTRPAAAPRSRRGSRRPKTRSPRG
jgi:hypothetical protein